MNILVNRTLDIVLHLVIPVLLILLVFSGSIYLLTEQQSIEGDISTAAKGDYEILEVSTRGETHEYLHYHRIYGHSLCHLPNCRFCQKTHKQE